MASRALAPWVRACSRLRSRLVLGRHSANLERSLEQALARGANALEAIRQESFGREVWIEGPEGNRLLLLEWAQ